MKTTLKATDSDPRLQMLVLEHQGVAPGGMATVNESVSELGREKTTRPQFANTPLKLADYSLTR